MGATEKLAREICWAGFSELGRKGKTKASYWKSISDEAKKRYINIADDFAFYAKKIGHDNLGTMISAINGRQP